MAYEFYITPEEYEIAASNGISKRTLDSRVRKYAWDKQRAITEPVKKSAIPEWVREQAKRNGIDNKTLYQRIEKNHWDYQTASTKPKAGPEQVKELGYKNRKYPKEFIELAASNGINAHSFYHRVREMKMSFHEAATKPLQNRKES